MPRNFLLAVQVTLLVVFSGFTPGHAENFSLPQAGDDLIGEIRHTKARQEDTLIDIARRFSVGQDEMVMANQNVDRWLPKAGTDVLIPQEYILPDAPRAGVVVNIPEMRLYYFPIKVRPAPVKPQKVKKAAAPVCKPLTQTAPSKTGAKPAATNGKMVAPKSATSAKTPAKAAPASKSASSAAGKGSAPKTASVKAPVCQPSTASKNEPTPVAAAPAAEFDAAMGQVITYPVSMGRMDWRTPLGMTRVVDKQKDPSWTPPASIKREHAAKGDPLPDVVPPGPDNPLGKYAMRLGVSGYLIHGTDAAKADGIGMRVTHGCMRMYNEDVAKLFPLIPVGAPVYLVNQPVKLGWKNGWLYMEVSQPLDEDAGVRGHDPDENVSKAQLDREDAQRSRYLLKIAMAEIDKMRAKTGAVINMDKVRKAIDKPTGIPLVIGGHEGDSSWESAAASDQGLAGKPKPKAVEAIDGGAENEDVRSGIPLPRPRITPPSESEGSDYVPVSRPKRVLPVPLPDEEPVSPRAPMPRSGSAYGGYDATPKPPSASGVKTMPYHEGEEDGEEEQ